MLWVRVTPLDGELAVASHWVVMLAMTTGEIIGTIIFAIGFIAFIAYYWNKKGEHPPGSGSPGSGYR